MKLSMDESNLPRGDVVGQCKVGGESDSQVFYTMNSECNHLKTQTLLLVRLCITQI